MALAAAGASFGEKVGTTSRSCDVLVVMFAATPDPPYTAVIFTSRRTTSDDAEYGRAAERMEELAGRQPGYLGIESARDSRTRFGITVSYWETEAAARSWKQVADHLRVQRLGAAKWYERYHVRIATVGRAYDRRTDRRQDLSTNEGCWQETGSRRPANGEVRHWA